MSNKYEQGKIYKVCDIAYTRTYYGSTIEPLCKRMGKYRYKYHKYKRGEGRDNITVFMIFDEFGIENCKIELVEIYPCASKMELMRKEGEYIKNNECVNKTVMGKTMIKYIKEYRDNNKEIIDQKKHD